ncbi:chemotaxis protein CheR [Massilia sp. Root351]|uniref:CheR family methyltransferase n=1 Tax=Massilia sp. Root351 TaxID=1736522 RepID=UPI00070A8F49|nr:protein-glutamate O-methyltransferase CheR [Massilia sp. Root351]KQV85349.1 chemotaxis protein CheR [Massilia sp. Root351]
MNEQDIVAFEIGLLVSAVKQAHGYDFSGYAGASLTRRLTAWLARSGYGSFGAATSALLRDAQLCRALVEEVTVNVSDMFRDPPFFKALREDVLPHLRTYPHARIWVAGCSGGEEVLSLAILLREEGMARQCRIYATDLNEAVLERARQGMFELRDMQRYTKNYQQAGGSTAFSDYYVARYGRALFDPELLRNVVFAAHNLATDADFSEMQLILCRNVMIYFKPALKERLLSLFDGCLTPGGFLCLGSKETLEQRAIAPRYREVAAPTRIYRKQYATGAPI